MRYLASYDFACEKASGNKIDYLRGETVYTIRKKPEAKWIVKNKLSATWVPGVQGELFLRKFFLPGGFSRRIESENQPIFLNRRDAIRLRGKIFRETFR